MKLSFLSKLTSNFLPVLEDKNPEGFEQIFDIHFLVGHDLLLFDLKPKKKM